MQFAFGSDSGSDDLQEITSKDFKLGKIRRFDVEASDNENGSSDNQIDSRAQQRLKTCNKFLQILYDDEEEYNPQLNQKRRKYSSNRK